ncbi:hypothetical protein [Ramlibacter sp.]|uniref:hypothetical protein n=1 Tax=Ramlibacter sp. TaxID=1917967 RepID=UPI002FC8FCEC
MYIVVIGWLYVALMMAVAEASNTNGSVLGAIFTFLLYGVLPVALVVYLMATPSRKKAIRAREQAEREEQARRRAQQERQVTASGQPDAGGESAAAAVPPVREEP